MKRIPIIHITLLVIGFFLANQWGFTQTTNIDSLKTQLQLTKADTLNILPMVTTGMKLPNKEYDAKMLIYQWVIQQSEKINYPKGTVWGYRSIAILHRDLFNSEEAIANMLKSIEIAERYKLHKLHALGLDGLAAIYRYNRSFDKAIEYDKAAIAVYEKYGGDKLGIGVIYYNLGSHIHDSIPVHRRKTINPEAIYYIRRGIKIAEDAEDNFVLLQLLTGSSAIYTEMKIFDTATLYLNKAELLINKLKVPRYYNSLYLRKGGLAFDQNDFQNALHYYKTGLLLVQKNKDPFYERDYLSKLNKTYAALGDTLLAYKYFYDYDKANDSINSDEKLKLTALIDGQFQKVKKEKEIHRLQVEQRIRQLELEKQNAIIAGNLAEAQKKQNEIALLSQQQEIQTLQIQQQKEDLTKKSLQAKAAEQEIQLANTAKELKEKQLSSQRTIRNYLLGGVGLLGILAFTLFRNIISKKKAYMQLENKSEQIREQALELGKQAKQIAQFQSQMNPHFVYNALHNIQGLVLNEEAEKANTQIVSLAQLMRKTFANAEKDDIPIDEEIAYLNKYVEFEKNAFDNNLNFLIETDIEARNVSIPPMMIQPFIENAIKHAELKKISNPYIRVLIEIENNLLSINIKDNGKGIEPKENDSDKLSHSISVIKSRLNLLFKGSDGIQQKPVFVIKSIPEISEGTMVQFYLPLNYTC